MAKNFTLTLARGIDIFAALGRRTAKSWAAKQLQTAVNVGLATLATPEALAKIADDGIVADINAMLEPGTITVVDDGTAPAAPATKAKTKPPATKAKGKAKAEPVAEEVATVGDAIDKAVAAVDAKEDAKATKAAKAAAAKADKAAKAQAAKDAKAKAAADKKAAADPVVALPEAKPEAKPTAAPAPGKAGGVRYGESRPFVCGKVLAEYGVLGGVTDIMVAAVDEMYPDANPRESLFALRNAWHAVRGYMGWVDAETTLESHGVAADAETTLESHGVAADAADAAPVCVGVRYAESRPYNAGAALATNGLAAGVNEATLALVDTLMGPDSINPRETAFAARNAWHAVRGYIGITNNEEAVAQDATR